MIYLDIQDVPEARRRGYVDGEDIVLVDYSGALYPQYSRIHSKTHKIESIVRCGPVQDLYHFDLTVPGIASILEQCVYAGWAEPYTATGEYTGELLPIRFAPVRGRGCRIVGSVDYPATVDTVLTGKPRPRVFDPDPGFDPVLLVMPPSWAEHSVRQAMRRLRRQAQFAALGVEQVGLREEWLDLSSRSIQA